MPHARLHKSYEINSGLKHGIFGDDIALQINVILAVYFGDDGPAEHEVELFIHLEPVSKKDEVNGDRVNGGGSGVRLRTR
jgi:hypothetical protein